MTADEAVAKLERWLASKKGKRALEKALKVAQEATDRLDELRKVRYDHR